MPEDEYENRSDSVLAWKRAQMKKAMESGKEEAGLYYLGEGEGVKSERMLKKGGRDVMSVLCE